MPPSESVTVLPLARAMRSRDEREFLPAALELVETPASPAARALAGSIALFLVIAIAWACWGSVDIVATAPGKIVPTGRTKVIQPMEIGVVRAIHVQDGQPVKAGDVLVELDPTTNAADSDKFESDLITARLDVARLKAALDAGGDPNRNPLAGFRPPKEAPAAQVELARQFVIHQVAEYRAKLAALDHQYARDGANRAAVAAEVNKLNVGIPLLRERAQAWKDAYDNEVGPRNTWLEVQQDLEEHQQELAVQQGRLQEAEASMAGTIEQRNQAEAEYERTITDQLGQAEQKVRDLSQELIKAKRHTELATLTAPVDGTVQQLAVHTVGGVVTPAQQLMAIVPADSRLEIEAMVPNKDIGFVHVGEPAEIKIDTFNFTKYGLLHGQVLNVSQDAISRDTPAAKPGDGAKGAPGDSSEPKGQELVYAARISLDRTAMEVDGRMINLAPGMAVTAEIKTGTRRVIEYLLSPVMKYKHESLRER
jgi:hemolysin D